MKLSIPCLYAAYGRYVDSFRAIPSNIDGLKISLRRALLSLHDVAKDKYTKSARVTGHMIGNYHPHGDISAYETIFTLVLQNYALGEGGWGAKDKDGIDSPSAQRYTECKLTPWVKDLAFKYIKYVPWENLELDDEPLYLPCPISIGLIGQDNITGIGFHRTVIPKYTKQDLAKRLIWLIENYHNYPKLSNLNEYTQEVCGPLIKPNFRDCQIKENDYGELYNILFNGTGNCRIIPNGDISNKKIYIKGRVPSHTFNKLIKDIDNNDLDFTMIDLSSNGEDPYRLNVELLPKKKKNEKELKTAFSNIWKKYLVKNINYQCYFVNDESIPEIYGIDDILINNYNYYIDAVLKYRIEQFENTNRKLFNNHIILIVKELISKYNIKSTDDLINSYKNDYPQFKKINLEIFQDNKFVTYEKEVDIESITEICNKNSIMKLINVTVDINQINQDIVDKKKDINNIYQDCQNEVVELTKK